MKKLLVLFALASVGFVSCKKEEVKPELPKKERHRDYPGRIPAPIKVDSLVVKY